MKKIKVHTTVSYLFAWILLAFGTAMQSHGGFGMSNIVTPAYVAHSYISQFLPFYTFGTAEYVSQIIVLIATMLIVRRVKASYLLSLPVAIIYGFVLDGAVALVSLLPTGIVARVIVYLIGMLLCCAGVALLFGSRLPLASHELIVKEVAERFSYPVYKVKIAYDVTCLAIAVIASLLLFGKLVGIGVGTVFGAFAYGPIIRLFQRAYDKIFVFVDSFERKPRLRKRNGEPENSG